MSACCVAVQRAADAPRSDQGIDMHRSPRGRSTRRGSPRSRRRPDRRRSALHRSRPAPAPAAAASAARPAHTSSTSTKSTRFLAIRTTASVMLYSRQGRPRHRACASPCRRWSAEELDVRHRGASTLIEGDTALTPDQGPTGGQHRRHARRRADCARLPRPRAKRCSAWRPSGSSVPPPTLTLGTATIARAAGGSSVAFGELVGDKRVQR